MKIQKVNRILLSVLIFFLFNPYVKADECNESYLKELANTVEVTAEFDEERIAKLGLYDSTLITVSGLTDEIYARTKDGKYAFISSEQDEDGNIKRSLFERGEITINIYSMNCELPSLRTIKLKAKRYNAFSTFSECEGLEDKVAVCSPDYDGELDIDKFNAELEKYKHSIQKDETGNPILKFINNNKVLIIFILGVIIVSIIVVSIVINYKKNKLE